MISFHDVGLENVIEALVDSEASVNAIDSNGNTALIFSVQNGELKNDINSSIEM